MTCRYVLCVTVLHTHKPSLHEKKALTELHELFDLLDTNLESDGFVAFTP